MTAIRTYTGAFRSVQGTLYKIDILKDVSTDLNITEPIEFSYDNAAAIEWNETDKLEPVQGSSLSVTLFSNQDRRFKDFYTEVQGSIRVKVYRDGQLYWCGALDPELYEEPYSYKEGYSVSLTFSDFAILDRMKWQERERMTMRRILEICLEPLGYGLDSLVSHISTTDATASVQWRMLDDVSLICNNFFDEHEEPMTLREVLEETLRPFALRIVQKNGKIYLYDLNALYALPTQPVVWAATDARLSTDTVYNNVMVTFSPYSRDEIVKIALKHDDVLRSQPIGQSGDLVRVREMLNEGGGVISQEGFRIVHGMHLSEEVTLHEENKVEVFRVDPEYSGREEAGILWDYRTKDTWAIHPQDDVFRQKPVFTTKGFYLNAIDEDSSFDRGLDMDPYKLCVRLQALFDVRYNPYERPKTQQGAEQAKVDRFNADANFAYIPMMFHLKGSDGADYYYDNNDVKKSDYYCREEKIESPRPPEMEGPPVITITKRYFPGWTKSEQPIISWLCYYDKENRSTSSGLGGGWKNNQRIVGHYTGVLPETFHPEDGGEVIPLPPVEGVADITIYSGLDCKNYMGANVENVKNIRWMMYKELIVSVIKRNGREPEMEDIEDMAWINKNACDDLSVDTIVGTMDNPMPAARGLVFDRKGIAYTSFRRGEAAGRLERLLINTAYSQYASRNNSLDGTAELIPEFTPMTDAGEPGHYIVLSERQDLLQDESEICMVEFKADEYNAIEEK